MNTKKHIKHPFFICADITLGELRDVIYQYPLKTLDAFEMPVYFHEPGTGKEKIVTGIKKFNHGIALVMKDSTWSNHLLEEDALTVRQARSICNKLITDNTGGYDTIVYTVEHKAIEVVKRKDYKPEIDLETIIYN